MDKAYIVRNIGEFQYINKKFLGQHYSELTMEIIMERFDGILVYGWARPEYDGLETMSNPNGTWVRHEIVEASDLMIKIIRRKKLKKLKK